MIDRVGTCSNGGGSSRLSAPMVVMSKRGSRKSRWDADDDFPERLEDARMRRGWTQVELSDATGMFVNANTISAWENGYVRRPNPRKLVATAQALGVSHVWLLRGEEDSHANDARKGRAR